MLKKYIFVFIVVLLLITSIAVYIQQGHSKLSTPRSDFIRLGEIKMRVKIADTFLLRNRGLSNMNSLEKDQGMLFIFEHSDRYRFWMKNIRFPIDIIWFDANRAVADLTLNALPEGSNPKRMYAPKTEVQYVLEAPSGFVFKNNITIGDILLLD